MAMDSENSSVGTDSFLDVITNFVGILIILVMVVGQRARNAPLPDVSRPADTALEAAAAEAAAVEGDVQRIAAKMRQVRAEMAARTFQRDQVQTLITAVEHDLAERRAALDLAARERFDVKRELALAEDELGRLKDQREQAEGTLAPPTITVESYPTPLGKTVDGKEAHFQLLGGRLTYVPFEALIDRLKATVRDYASKMNTEAQIVDTLGPIGGFRMRYAVERFDTPQGSYLQVARVELLPVSKQLGDPIATALASGSRFREKLEMMSSREYTITVWTYPDSFAEFRRLKKELYEMGYAVAGRPLPEGMPIGASPHGSKSSAQ
jgi:hypothetical protein